MRLTVYLGLHMHFPYGWRPFRERLVIETVYGWRRLRLVVPR